MDLLFWHPEQVMSRAHVPLIRTNAWAVPARHCLSWRRSYTMSCFVVISWSEFLIIQWMGEHIRENIYRYDPHTPSKRLVQWSQQWESRHFQVYIVCWNHKYRRFHCNWMNNAILHPARDVTADSMKGISCQEQQVTVISVTLYVFQCMVITYDVVMPGWWLVNQFETLYFSLTQQDLNDHLLSRRLERLSVGVLSVRKPRKERRQKENEVASTKQVAPGNR